MSCPTSKQSDSGRERGGALIETGLLMVLITIVLIVAVRETGTNVSAQYSDAASKIVGGSTRPIPSTPAPTPRP